MQTQGQTQQYRPKAEAQKTVQPTAKVESQVVEPLVPIPEPDQNRFQAAKTFQFSRVVEFGEVDFLAVDSYVDAKDTVNKWCVAQVKNVNPADKTVLITFDGWSIKYDIEVKRHSSKIAPFRTHTQGYTGQVSHAIREFKFNQTYLSVLENKINEIISSDFRCFKSAHECTQFVRGELFFYIDSILTFQTATSKEDLPPIFNFLEAVFKMILRWYQLLPSYITSWKEAQQTPSLFNVDLSAAISVCCYEVTQILGNLFGTNQRTLGVFTRYKQEYLFQGAHVNISLIQEDGFRASLINKIGSLGGFKRLMDFASHPDIPLSILTEVLGILRGMSNLIDPNNAKQVSNCFRLSLKNRLEKIQQQEMRETEKEIIQRAIRYYEKYCIVCDPSTAPGKVSEILECQIALQYFKSQLFEMKLRGMNEFKSIFKKIQNSSQYTEEQIRRNQLVSCKYLNYNIFSDFLKQNDVLGLIFCDSPHPEIIKRSLELLYVRSRNHLNQPFDDVLIDQIWTCCVEKHEAVSRAAFSVLQNLIQYLDVKALELIWKRVKSLDENEFDELRVGFLKEYTIGALACLQKHQEQLIREQSAQQLSTSASSKSSGMSSMFKRNEPSQSQQKKQAIPQIQSQNYLNLTFFWKIGQEVNTTASQKTKDLAINCLIEILSRNSYQFQNLPQRLDFIKLALDNLKSGISVQTSLLFIKQVLLTFNLDNQSTTKYTGTTQQNNQLNDQSPRERVVQQLVQEKVFDLIIVNAQNYMKIANQLSICNLDTKVIGVYTHKERIDSVFNLVEFLIVNSKNSNLEFQQVSQLFDSFVNQATTPYETEQFFLFLTKENENSATRERKYLLDEKRRTDVFQKILCNSKTLDCSKLVTVGFNCFKLLFMNVNVQLNHIKLDPKNSGVFQVQSFKDLLGFETLWHVAILSNDQSVRDEARNFLVDLYLNCYLYNKITEKQKREITDLFLEKLNQVFAQLSLKSGTNGLGENWHRLKLITTFIRRFDFEHILEENINKYNQNQNLEVPITLLPHNITKVVQVNSNMKMWQLILQASKAFQIRISEFRIETKGGTIGTEINGNLISQYVINNISIRRIDEKILEKESPRRLVAQNTELIDKLINSISDLNSQTDFQQTEAVIQDTFDLIEVLPINIKNKNQFFIELDKMKPNQGSITQLCELFRIETPNNQNFSYMQRFSPYSCYYLMLFQDLLIESSNQSTIQMTKEEIQSEKQARVKLSNVFLEKNGLDFLIDVFNASDKENLNQSVLRQRIMQIIQTIIIFIFKSSTKLIIRQSLKTFFLQSMRLLQTQTQLLLSLQQIEERDQLAIRLTLDLIQLVLDYEPQLVTLMYSLPDFDQTLLSVYTQMNSHRVQELVSKCLLQICNKVTVQKLESEGVQIETLQDQASVLPNFYFAKLILKRIIPATLQFKTNTESTYQFYKFATVLIVDPGVSKLIHLIEPVEVIVLSVSEMIRERPILEMQSSSINHDYVLSGLMCFLRNLLSVRHQDKVKIQNRSAIINYLLHDCLFLKEFNGSSIVNRNQAVAPKCKTSDTRSECLSLIRELCEDYEDGIIYFVEYLRDIVFSRNVSWFWRTPRRLDWQITADNKQERSITGYVGLKNIGCICYMNSIIQQLYMIAPFRKAMLEVQDKNMDTEPKAENTLYQIKRIFSGLMQLEKQYYNPKKFCQSFKDIDGSPIDPRVQKDVDEFFHMFIDRIESLIKGTKEEAVMKNLFYGVFANELICKGCPHTSEREETFMAVSVQVKNKHSVMESLESFVQGEMLEGDNAYYCEKCEKKRDTLKRCTIKRLPNVLFIELKRFEFDFDTMSKTKLNDYCEFPMDLDMTKYSQEYIKRQDLMREMESNSLSYEDLDEDQRIVYNKVQSSEYFQYQLVGTVVHQGTADSGHYYSFIKEREEDSANLNQWFEFNDKDVGKFDMKNIPNETFGGDDPEFENKIRQFSNDQEMQQVLVSQGRSKNRNAYILIYERKQFVDQTRFNEFMDDNQVALSKKDEVYTQQSASVLQACKLPTTISGQIQILPEIQQEIQEKNRRFWLTKHVFNRQFIDRAYEIFDKFKINSFSDYQLARNGMTNDQIESEKVSIYKFVITFMLTVVVRCNSRVQIPNYVKIIRQALQQHVSLALWFCQLFTCQSMIKEFLIDCPVMDMSRFVSGLLATAMQTVYRYEEQQMEVYIENLVDVDNYILKTQSKNIKQTVVKTKTPNGDQIGVHQESPVFTQANSVKVYKVHSINKEIPLLIAMINSFIHYQGSNNYFENWTSSQQFQRVFSSFTDLGQTACLYLLKTGQLLRFLRLLLAQKDEGNQQLCEIPLFHFEHQTDQVLTRNQNEGIDAKVHMADRKFAQSQQPTGPYAFLIKSLYNMIRNCTTSTREGEANNFYLIDRQEIDLITLEIGNRGWWRSSSLEYPFARNAASKLWANLCQNDQKLSQIYIKEIFNLVATQNFIFVKKLERPLVDLLALNDDYQNERIVRVLNSLYDQMKKNTQYWKQVDSLIELTLKLSRKNKPFAVELFKNKNILTMIGQITKENPSFPITQQSVKLFKEGMINWSNLPQSHKHLVTEQKVSKIGSYSKQRLATLNQVLQEQQTAEGYDDTNYVDSDDDCFGVQLNEGDILDAKFAKQPNFYGWYKARVVTALDEMVKVEVLSAQNTTIQTSGTWIAKESSSLAKENTYANNEKMQNHLYFIELYKLVEMAQTQQADAIGSDASRIPASNQSAQK